MKSPTEIAYVNLSDDEPAEQAAPFFFQRFDTSTFLNPPSDRPHRHNFQELILVESGYARHSVDGLPVDLVPHTLSLVARGQVHAFDRAIELTGWMLRFADDFLPTGRVDEGLTLTALFTRPDQAPTLALRPVDVQSLNEVARLIEAEWSAADQPHRLDALRHLLALLLLRVERLHRTAVGAGHAAHDEQRIYQDFMALLERDFARRHDVQHYAASLGLTPVRLSQILRRILAKATKRVIDERLVLETKRYLRYTPLTLKEIAVVLGYSDQFHLSKAFKRLTGAAPQSFRQLGRPPGADGG